jgi:hypothetical protein
VADHVAREGEGGGRKISKSMAKGRQGEGKTEGKAKPREGSRGSSRREEMEELDLPIKEYTFSEKAVNFS